MNLVFAISICYFGSIASQEMAISATDFHWTRTLSQNSWREDPVGARPAALSSAGASVLERAFVDDGDREPRRGARIGLLFRKACNGSYEKWQKWAPFRSSGTQRAIAVDKPRPGMCAASHRNVWSVD